MSVDAETLMAYVDGELDAVSARRVERAVAADPALKAELERHRALSAQLRAAFAPIAEAPVPEGVAQLLRESARVVPIAEARKRRPVLGWAGAIAASLLVGVFTGQMMGRGGDVAVEGGALVAQGELARALDTQLASVQAPDAPVRIGLSFRDRDGRLCRSFEQAAMAGIACAGKGERWRLARSSEAERRSGTPYRQAGSPMLMAEAQAMMEGAPLDAAQEKAALAARR